MPERCDACGHRKTVGSSETICRNSHTDPEILQLFWDAEHGDEEARNKVQGRRCPGYG